MRAQSSYWKFAYNGSPVPTSFTSSTAYTSKSATTMSIATSFCSTSFFSSISSTGFSSVPSSFCSSSPAGPSFASPSSLFSSSVPIFSSSFFSAAFVSAAFVSAAFASAAFASARRAFFFSMTSRLCMGSFHWLCLVCQSCKIDRHSVDFSLNQWPGSRSSTFCVSFCSPTHAFKCSSLFDSSAHTNRISSKPSSLVGIVKLRYCLANSFAAMSITSPLRKHICFSSSVSSTASTAFLTASSSGSSASFASSPFFSSSSFSPWAPLELACFFRSSRALFLLTSRSAAACFALNVTSCAAALNLAGGSPITTTATRLRSPPSNSSRSFFRSPAIRLFLTSMTTQLLLSMGATVRMSLLALESSSSQMPKSIPGLSLVALKS
mmetsp:Transcript_84979/g.237112  ORF Transcript_84979/g.237112 Transcript_84979/m.237112 type:complete len:380 (+) Transcript_84979:707-1846(+)